MQPVMQPVMQQPVMQQPVPNKEEYANIQPSASPQVGQKYSFF
jgi:hypothetical protein